MITRIAKKMLALAVAAVMLVGVMPLNMMLFNAGAVSTHGAGISGAIMPVNSTAHAISEAPIYSHIEMMTFWGNIEPQPHGVNQIGTLIINETVRVVSHGQAWVQHGLIGGSPSGLWLGIEVRGLRGYVRQETHWTSGLGFVSEQSRPLVIGPPPATPAPVVTPTPTPAVTPTPAPGPGNWWEDRPDWWNRP